MKILLEKNNWISSLKFIENIAEYVFASRISAAEPARAFFVGKGDWLYISAGSLYQIGIVRLAPNPTKEPLFLSFRTYQLNPLLKLGYQSTVEVELTDCLSVTGQLGAGQLRGLDKVKVVDKIYDWESPPSYNLHTINKIIDLFEPVHTPKKELIAAFSKQQAELLLKRQKIDKAASQVLLQGDSDGLTFSTTDYHETKVLQHTKIDALHCSEPFKLGFDRKNFVKINRALASTRTPTSTIVLERMQSFDSGDLMAFFTRDFGVFFSKKSTKSP